MFPSRTLPILGHIIGWLLFFSLIAGFLHTSREGSLQGLLSSDLFLGFCFIYLFLFYFNSYVLVPVLYLQQRYLLYAFVVLILFGAVYRMKPFDRLMEAGRPERAMQTGPAFDVPEGAPPGPLHPRGDGGKPGDGGRTRDAGKPDKTEEAPPTPGAIRRPGAGPAIDTVSIVLFAMVWAFSTAYQIIRQWRRTEQRAMQAETEKAQAETEKAEAELFFLKAQVHPHFLFNTLNNIYSLSLVKDDAAPAAILQLSYIMRYVTDEAMQDYVPLMGELQCVSDYIQLQRLWLNENTPVEFSVSGVLEDKQIAPLLLMTFIENVFKYGVSHHSFSPITIRIETDASTIRFFCRNRLLPGNGMHVLDRQPTGINNTRKRLQLLYPDRHTLEVLTDNDSFTVFLTLQL